MAVGSPKMHRSKYSAALSPLQTRTRQKIGEKLTVEIWMCLDYSKPCHIVLHLCLVAEQHYYYGEKYTYLWVVGPPIRDQRFNRVQRFSYKLASLNSAEQQNNNIAHRQSPRERARDACPKKITLDTRPPPKTNIYVPAGRASQPNSR